MPSVSQLAPPPRFTQEADAYLEQFYTSARVVEVNDKISALEERLGGSSEFYAFGGEVTPEMRLGCLEYEYLLEEGMLKLDEELLF